MKENQIPKNIDYWRSCEELKEIANVMNFIITNRKKYDIQRHKTESLEIDKKINTKK